MPADPDPLPRRPARNIGADFIDAADHLVARHPRILEARPQSILGAAVAVADAARLDLDPDRAGAGLPDVPLDEFERPARLPHLDRAHLRHIGSPQLIILMSRSRHPVSTAPAGHLGARTGRRPNRSAPEPVSA